MMRALLVAVLSLVAVPAWAQTSVVVTRTTQTVHRVMTATDAERYLHGHAFAWTVVAMDPCGGVGATGLTAAIHAALDLIDGNAAVFAYELDINFYVHYQALSPTRGVLVNGHPTHQRIAAVIRNRLLYAFDGTAVAVAVQAIVNGVTVVGAGGGDVQELWSR